jgi:PAS domain S-box-containing protein
MIDEAALGVLADHSQDKIAVLDENGTFRYANGAVEHILGYDPEELVGESAFEYVHPDDRPEVESVFTEMTESEASIERTTTYRFRASDGSWVWMESRMSKAADSELDGYVVSSRDVTARIEAERKYRETAAQLEGLTAVSGDVLWMFTRDWSELLFINQAYEDVHGRPVAELEADPTTFLDTVHPDDIDAVEQAMTSLSAGREVDIEYRVNPERDYEVRVWVRGQPIREDGEVVRLTGFTRDITRRHRRERQLYVMDNLLRHNLRNDMNVILGAAEMIEEAAPEVADRAEVIRQTGSDLLASAEKERDVIDFLVSDAMPTQIDLVEAVDVAVATISERFPTATINRTLPDSASASAVENLGIVIVELIENAIRHSDGDHPTVSITVEERAETTELVVVDECPPFPDNEVNVLTGEQEMSNVYHSTGLGLWLVYWGVELSDGDIAVERMQTGGNRIRIALPSTGA